MQWIGVDIFRKLSSGEKGGGFFFAKTSDCKKSVLMWRINLSNARAPDFLEKISLIRTENSAPCFQKKSSEIRAV